MGDAPEQVCFGVLGPFEVLVDGHAAALGGARQRLVLAGLVAHANAVVSSDRLIDIVWGDEPPSTALSTLQKYVHRLRGTLADRLVTRAPGYAVRVEREELDAFRFESLLAEAGRLTTAGELDDAIATFDAALALWRGPAWAEFADFDFTRPEVARLEGLRATAIEDRTEVALAAGHHAEVIGELEATVVRYPLRERPRAQLMLALYRAGRQVEALRVYDAFRRYLGEEVGLEPSVSLAQLADAIVVQKPELDWVPAPRARGRAALPSGLVTFLFSDIEGSTRLFRQLGHGFVELLERHRRLVRAAVAGAGGVEVNSEGDGLFFAFADAAAALEASVTAQRAIAGEAWPAGAEVRVRMGLHTGEATPRDGDYIAMAVHQANRVKDAAHGGQVLLSGETVASIGAMPADCSVRELGVFALKDFDHGVGLFEACDPSRPESGFPPPRVDVAPRAAPLPAILAADTEALVGRTTDLEWLDVLWQRAVAGERVTAGVHGPPGIGKSRLLAEFARRAHAGGATVTVSAPEGQWAGAEPVLAVLDDCDGVSLDELAAGVTGVFLLGASRHPPAGTPNGRELSGLSRHEVEVLLAQKVETVSTDLADAVYAETDGSPGHVQDLARRLRDRDAEERVVRALERVGLANREARWLRDEIAGGVLERQAALVQANEPVVSGVCPYKGLARYEATDAPFFYGRERLVATLVARLAVDRFVGVVGASGSGKSSLVRAGLLPALSAAALPGSDAWPTCTFTPGEHPLRRFAEALAPLVEIPAPELARRLDRQPDELGSMLEAAVRGREGARVVVVVDQFEEIGTLCRDQEERERFAGALVDAVTDPDIPAAVVAVVRADYYGTLTVHPELAQLFEQSQVLVGAMSDAELRRAITEPARRAGLVLEDALADAVCADAGSEPGALPLVSTAMAETWVRRDGITLTLAGYGEAGGVHGALGRLADDVYDGLGPDGQALARRLFLRLAEPGEGTDDVRRRAARSEFPTTDEAEQVLDAFVQRRLIVASEGHVEVAHEALLREWPRLRTWLEEDREGRRLHRHLTEAAAAWAVEQRDPAALYRGARLAAAREWASSHEDANPLELEFLDASVAAQEAELGAARRTARRLRRLTTVVAVVAVLALLAGGIALVQRSNANDKAARARRSATAEAVARNSADAARLTSDASRLASQARAFATTQLDLALLLAVQGRHLQRSDVTDGAVESVLTHTGAGLDQIVSLAAYPGPCPWISPDGRLISVAGSDGVVRLVDTATGRLKSTLPGNTGLGQCGLATFNADGSRVISTSSNGKVLVWDTATGKEVGVPLAAGCSVPAGAAGWELSPGRTAVVTACGPQTIWDTSDPEHPVQVGAPFTLPVNGFLPGVYLGDRTRPDLLALSTLGETEVYNVATHELAYPKLPGISIGGVTSDDKTIATESGAHEITFWDVATGAPKGRLTGLSNSYRGMSFSPDGTRFALADLSAHLVRVYDVASTTEVATIPLAGNGAVLRYLNDGRLALYEDQNIELWRVGVTAPVPFATVLGVPPGPVEASFTPDGHRAITTAAGSVGAWDVTTAAPVGTAHQFGGAPGDAGLLVQASPNGSTVAVPHADGSVELFDAASGSRHSVIETTQAQPFVRWSQRGSTLAVGGSGGVVSVWDVSDPDRPALVARATAPGIEKISGAIPVFSPDGRWLAVESVVGVFAYPPDPVSLFAVPSGRLEHVLSGPIGYPVGMSFSADSKTLAVGYTNFESSTGGTGSAVEWDVATGTRRLSLALPYFPATVGFLAGSRLVTSEYASSVNIADLTTAVSRVDIWDATTLRPIGEPVLVTGDAATLAADPSGQRLVSGSSSPVGVPMLWDVDPDHWESTACRIAGRNLTRAEWNEYLPGRAYQVTCPQWPAVT
jgi:DNA-binding SARP family transcriptional activator/WD40 repeat protein